MDDQKSVLVVDDDPSVVEFLSVILRSDGYQVYGAVNGSEALHVLKQEPIDLVLLDLMMSKMDGFQLLNRVRESWPDQRVIVVSALLGDSIVRSIMLRVQDYVVKPFSPDELCRSVEYALRRSPRR